MKKVIKASTSTNKAKAILKKAKELMNMLDAASDRFLNEHDLMPLYDELVETIPGLSRSISSKISTSSSKDFSSFDSEDWAKYIAIQLDLSEDEEMDIVHDINNLRADEVYDAYFDDISDKDAAAAFRNTYLR